MIWFTSDTHFGHENVIKFCNRPFRDVDHMNSELILRWNEKVKNGDQIYHLGDFSFMKKPETEKLLSRLKGQIFLVRGNHDHKDTRGIKSFAWVKDYHEIKVEIDGQKQLIVLSHYPILSWHNRHYGAWHLHGHCHGSLPDEGVRRIDVGCDVYGYSPVSLDEINNIMKNRPITSVDHHTVKI